MAGYIIVEHKVSKQHKYVSVVSYNEDIVGTHICNFVNANSIRFFMCDGHALHFRYHTFIDLNKDWVATRDNKFLIQHILVGLQAFHDEVSQMCPVSDESKDNLII